MSTRNIYWNQQYNVTDPRGVVITVGPKGQLVSSGTNQVGDGELIPHPYSLTYYDRGDSYVIYDDTRAGFPDQWGLLQVEAKMERAWTSNDDYELYGKLREAYDESDFNAGVFAGELGETTDMLAGSVRRLAQAGRLARKGRFAEAAKVLGKKPRRASQREPASDNELHERWLELQYGWKPLMGDISNLADLIATKDKPRKRRIRVQHSIPMIPYCNNLYWEAEGYAKYSKQIIAYITEDRPSPTERLGLHDPSAIVWELVPFSFVADWVYPIGDYLLTRSFASRAKGTFVITTRTKHILRAKGISPAYKPSPYNTLVLQPELGLVAWNRRVNITRTVSSSLPTVDLPVWRNPLSGLTRPGAWNLLAGGNHSVSEGLPEGPAARLLNAVALARAVFGGSTTRY